jgi:hypothetical protein
MLAHRTHPGHFSRHFKKTVKPPPPITGLRPMFFVLEIFDPPEVGQALQRDRGAALAPS